MNERDFERLLNTLQGIEEQICLLNAILGIVAEKQCPEMRDVIGKLYLVPEP